MTAAAPGPSTPLAELRIELHVELIDAAAGLEAIRTEWAKLNQVARAGSLFLGPEWLIPWWKHFGGGRELQVIAVREAGALVGLLPLFTERVRLGGVAARRLALLGDGATGCDYLDALALPRREAAVLEAALQAAFALPWDLCELDGMLRESPTTLLLADRHPPGSRSAAPDSAGAASSGPRRDDAVRREAQLRFVCPYIPLRGTYEEYLAGLGRRENLKRREKWLLRQPGFEVAVASTPAGAPAALETFFELHRARWAAEGGSDGLADARFEAFHRDAVANLAAAGMLRLYTLSCARRAVASVYGVVFQGRFLYYQSGADPLWARSSAGLVLLARTVKDAFAAGLSEFDFLRGDESYKAQWKRAERWTVRVQLFRGTRGSICHATSRAATAARSGLKSAIPDQALNTARIARRLLRAPRPAGETRFEGALRLLSAARGAVNASSSGTAAH